MRSYPRNSPEAVARLLSLAAVADGHVSPVELEALEVAGAELPDGLTGERLHEVLRSLCHDLLGAERLSWVQDCSLDDAALASLLTEIDDPQLRLKALGLALRIAQADRHVHEAESQLLVSAISHWGLLDEIGATPVRAPAPAPMRANA